jgi:hypothetical protein
MRTFSLLMPNSSLLKKSDANLAPVNHVLACQAGDVGKEPPIQSALHGGALSFPTKVEAKYLPPSPLPRTTGSYSSPDHILQDSCRLWSSW